MEAEGIFVESRDDLPRAVTAAQGPAAAAATAPAEGATDTDTADAGSASSGVSASSSSGPVFRPNNNGSFSEVRENHKALRSQFFFGRESERGVLRDKDVGAGAAAGDAAAGDAAAEAGDGEGAAQGPGRRPSSLFEVGDTD